MSFTLNPYLARENEDVGAAIVADKYDGAHYEPYRTDLSPEPTDRPSLHQQPPRGLGIAGAPGFSLADVASDDIPGPRYRLLERLGEEQGSPGEDYTVRQAARPSHVRTSGSTQAYPGSLLDAEYITDDHRRGSYSNGSRAGLSHSGLSPAVGEPSASLYTPRAGRAHELRPLDLSLSRPSSASGLASPIGTAPLTTAAASSPYAYAYAHSQQQAHLSQPLRSAAPTPVTARPSQTSYAVNPYLSGATADFGRRLSFAPLGIEDEPPRNVVTPSSLAPEHLRRRSSLTQYLAQHPLDGPSSVSSRPGSSSSVGKAHLQNLLNGEPPFASSSSTTGGAKSPLYDHLRPSSSSSAVASFDAANTAYSHHHQLRSSAAAAATFLSPPQQAYYDAPLRASGSRLRIDPSPVDPGQAGSLASWSAAISPYDRPGSSSAFRSHPHSPLDLGQSPTYLSHKNPYLYTDMPTAGSRQSNGSSSTGGAMSVQTPLQVSPGGAGKRPMTRAQAAAVATAARGLAYDDPRGLYPAPGSSIGGTSTFRDYSTAGSMGAPPSTAPLRSSVASSTGYPPLPTSANQRSMLGQSSATSSGPQTRGKVYRKELFQRNDGKQQSVTIIDDEEEDESTVAGPSGGDSGAYKRKAAVTNGATSAMTSAGKKRRLDHDPAQSISGSAAKRPYQPESAYTSSKAAAPTSDVTVVNSRNGVASHHVPNGHSYAVASNHQQKPPAGYPAPTVENPTPWDDKEGHYIVQPNTFFAAKDKYRIIRLLGQGTFGKVVEAKEAYTGRKVAIKIIRAVQKYRDAAAIEIRVLQTLKAHDPDNFFKCIHLIETFDFRNHICLVSELFGMSVFDFLKTNHYQPFPEAHIQSFAKSLLSSLSFVHGLKLIHTDLKPENILLVQNGHYNINERRAGVKARFILRNPEIRLIDFGSATFENEFHSSVVSTRHYRAPEIILGLGWSFPCDMYSIGCILVEFYTGEALFQTHDNLEHLAMMEVVRGKMPIAIARRAQRFKPEFFNRETRLDYPNAQTSKGSRKYVKQMKKLDAIIQPTNPLRKQFHDLVYRMLAFDPAKRINVHEALSHAYFSIAAPPPPGPP